MKRDTIAALAVLVLAASVFYLTRETPPGAAAARDPYRPAESESVLVRYASEGGFGPDGAVEIVVRGPGECVVRRRAGEGREAAERRHPLSEAGFDELLRRFSRADFFEQDELPAASVSADAPKISLALTIGARSHEVVLDGRRRPSKELGAVLELLDGIRKATAPEQTPERL